MNLYDTSRFPSKIIPPLVKLTKLYHGLMFFVINRHDKKNIIFKEYQKTRPLGVRPIICYAPFKSMYFGIDGKVTACCMNRINILGSCPEMTIKQIWEGAQIKTLRKKLEKYDMNPGCLHCLQNIECGNYDAVTARHFDILPAIYQYPSMMEFELSNACNLECIMCTGIYSSAILKKEANIKTTDNLYDDKFLLQLDEFLPHLKKTKFLGGEPFLIPIYYRIWKRLIEVNPNCLIIVQTNASILNDKIKALLRSGNFIVNVSVDSFQKETYEKIRKNSNFDIVMQNTEYFRKHSVINNYLFSVAICPIQQNWKELPDMVKYCNRLNMLVFFNTVWIPAECSLYYLSVNKLKDVLQYMISAKLSGKTRIEKRNFVHFNDFINLLKDWIRQKELLVMNWKDEEQKLANINLNEMIMELTDTIQKYYLVHTEYSNDLEKIKGFIARCYEEMADYSNEFYFKKTIYRFSLKPVETMTEIIKNMCDEDMKGLPDTIILEMKKEEDFLQTSIEDEANIDGSNK